MEPQNQACHLWVTMTEFDLAGACANEYLAQ